MKGNPPSGQPLFFASIFSSSAQVVRRPSLPLASKALSPPSSVTLSFEALPPLQVSSLFSFPFYSSPHGLFFFFPPLHPKVDLSRLTTAEHARRRVTQLPNYRLQPPHELAPVLKLFLFYPRRLLVVFPLSPFNRNEVSPFQCSILSIFSRWLFFPWFSLFSLKPGL